jgi:hypothetical protein
METNEIFWPARGTCGLNTGDIDLVDGGLQRREGRRRARGTPYILGGKIAMREHTWYIHEGFRGGRGETVAERARLSLETAMSVSMEGIATRYLCAMSSTEYRGPDARGSRATVPNRTYHFKFHFSVNTTPFYSHS